MSYIRFIYSLLFFLFLSCSTFASIRSNSLVSNDTITDMSSLGTASALGYNSPIGDCKFIGKKNVAISIPASSSGDITFTIDLENLGTIAPSSSNQNSCSGKTPFWEAVLLFGDGQCAHFRTQGNAQPKQVFHTYSQGNYNAVLLLTGNYGDSDGDPSIVANPGSGANSSTNIFGPNSAGSFRNLVPADPFYFIANFESVDSLLSITLENTTHLSTQFQYAVLQKNEPLQWRSAQITTNGQSTTLPAVSAYIHTKLKNSLSGTSCLFRMKPGKTVDLENADPVKISFDYISANIVPMNAIANTGESHDPNLINPDPLWLCTHDQTYACKIQKKAEYTYKIHFENIGPVSAKHVFLKFELDPRVKLIPGSYRNWFYNGQANAINYSSDGNYLYLPNINLSGSNYGTQNIAESYCEFEFKVSTIRDIDLGTEMPIEAEMTVYFDPKPLIGSFSDIFKKLISDQADSLAKFNKLNDLFYSYSEMTCNNCDGPKTPPQPPVKKKCNLFGIFSKKGKVVAS